MKGVDVECPNDENRIISCKLSKEVLESFHSILKQGIYKELHKQNLLTDAQLNSLLSDKQA